MVEVHRAIKETESVLFEAGHDVARLFLFEISRTLYCSAWSLIFTKK